MYLVGGTREEAEVVRYPAAKMKAVVDRTGPKLMWGVKGENMMSPKSQPFKK